MELFGLELKHEWVVENLGKELAMIRSDSLEPCSERVTSASGHELLCSYNWGSISGSKSQRGKKPTGDPIYVPGEAPVVQPAKLPVTMSLKWSQSHRDANAARMPEYPLEPMFQSLATMNPGFRFDDTDILINRSALSSLFHFSGDSCRGNWSLNVALIHNTLVVSPRWERIPADGPMDSGRNFERIFTKYRKVMKNMGASSSHHRVIRYKLGPLNVAVLFETDGAYYGTMEGAVPVEEDEATATQDVGEDEMVFRMMPKVELPTKLPMNPPSSYQPLHASIFTEPTRKPHTYHPQTPVVLQGTGTSCSLTAELVARIDTPRHRTAFRKFPQLWFGRTRYLVHGTYQQNREFVRVQVLEYDDLRMQRWEERHQAKLQKLVPVIQRLREVARLSRTNSCIAYCTKAARPLTIKIHEQVVKRDPFPRNMLLSRFWSAPEVDKVR